MIAEDDKVVVRNRWTATDSQSEKKLEFRRHRDLANRQPENRRALGLPRSPAPGLIDATKSGTHSPQSALRVTHPERAA
jgi:hypothetical protein